MELLEKRSLEEIERFFEGLHLRIVVDIHAPPEPCAEELRAMPKIVRREFQHGGSTDPLGGTAQYRRSHHPGLVWRRTGPRQRHPKRCLPLASRARSRFWPMNPQTLPVRRLCGAWLKASDDGDFTTLWASPYRSCTDSCCLQGVVWVIRAHWPATPDRLAQMLLQVVSQEGCELLRIQREVGSEASDWLIIKSERDIPPLPVVVEVLGQIEAGPHFEHASRIRQKVAFNPPAALINLRLLHGHMLAERLSMGAARSPGLRATATRRVSFGERSTSAIRMCDGMPSDFSTGDRLLHDGRP